MSGEAEGRQAAFFWLAALVLGGLVFAAGVFVGRGLGQSTCDELADPLARLDQPAALSPAPDGGLDFPRTLEGPPLAPPRPPVRPGGEVRAEPARAPGAPDAGSGVAGGAEDGDGVPQTPPAGAVVGERVFCLQVAAYREASQAEGLLARLRAAGYPDIRVVSSEAGDRGTYHRVRVGNWLERASAERARERLAQEERLNPMVMQCEQ